MAAQPVVPPVLYVPCAGHGSAGQEAGVELRRLDDGRVALLAYTALDRLVQGCGPFQPWVMIETEALGEIDRSQPYDVIVLDAVIPEQLRWTAGNSP